MSSHEPLARASAAHAGGKLPHSRWTMTWPLQTPQDRQSAARITSEIGSFHADAEAAAACLLCVGPSKPSSSPGSRLSSMKEILGHFCVKPPKWKALHRISRERLSKDVPNSQRRWTFHIRTLAAVISCQKKNTRATRQSVQQYFAACVDTCPRHPFPNVLFSYPGLPICSFDPQF